MAGVFGNLFENDELAIGSDDFQDFDSVARKPGLPAPPRPRPQCNLSGISNQGATCYLNSLLQTLLYTPEFRDGLFCLGENDLGNLQDVDKPGSKVRIIPIQLQRLFVRLLLKNCQALSTVELTESFGWTNDEQFQQQDVQELNRILFSAIESSLVGTVGKDLIQQLYHGRIVNQIQCTECGKVSEREEDFLDVPVTVAGSCSLEQSLQAGYRDVEMLDGKNQYMCSGCNKLVDAAKGAKLRCLPSILTMSLLRFSFNFQRMERYKETGKFTFPHAINMRPYCDNAADDEDLNYELFSVVIHSGGAYGGHYHAYIRDIDNLGNWVTPEEEEIIVPKDRATEGVDFIECKSPSELIQHMLSKEKNKGLPMDKLGPEIMKQTGTSWNKRFKSKYGSMTKFLTKHDDTFIFDPVHKHVSLKIYGVDTDNKSKTTAGKTILSSDTNLSSTCNANKMDTSEESHDQSADMMEVTYSEGKNMFKNKNTTHPYPGRAWFDFNDSGVHPIYERALEKQVSGRESAYMLFYRKRSLVRPNKAQGNKLYCMPEQLINEVVEENQNLYKQREEYDIAVNSLTLQIHFSSCYQYREGALKPTPGLNDWRELVIDQRKNTCDLYTGIREFGVELLPSNDFQINKFKELPAGGHIYDIVPESDDLSLKYLDIHDGSKLFVWNGKHVQDQLIPMGIDSEPIFLTVIYGDGLQFSQGYSRSSTVQEVMVMICEYIRIQGKDIRLKRLFGKDSNSEVKVVPFSGPEVYSTLAELNFKDGDQLLAEDKADKRPGLSEKSITSTVYSSKFLIHIENRCIEPSAGTYDFPSNKIEVDKTISVAELKAIVMARFGLVTVPEGGRLRIDHDQLGLRHPIHEEMTVFDAGISQGSRLVLEPGPSPKTDEITLMFTCEKLSGPDLGEVMVKRNTSVEDCLCYIMSKANIIEEDWHLRKTNWCGEAADLLDDPELSLDASLVNDGDLLLLEKGRLPPKGFIRLPIWLHSTPESVKTAGKQDAGIMSWMSSIYNMFTLNNTTVETSRTGGISSKPHPIHLGEVEVSRETTLNDLKQQVMTLNVVAALPIPSPEFMRLRLVEKNRLTTILRDRNQTLKRLKLTSNSVLALQILSEEEDLHQNQIVLEVCQRIPDTNYYNPGVELIWDTGKGASIHSLCTAVSEVLFTETEHLCMAKRFPQRYEWLLIEKKENTGNQKGRQKKQMKGNIKQAPYHICDGDTIGVKDVRYDPNNLDDFMTEEDVVGREQLQQEMEEKRKLREERKNMANDFGPVQKQRRPEVGIKIKVGDFS